jgi:hypothetical protein
MHKRTKGKGCCFKAFGWMYDDSMDRVKPYIYIYNSAITALQTQSIKQTKNVGI